MKIVRAPRLAVIAKMCAKLPPRVCRANFLRGESTEQLPESSVLRDAREAGAATDSRSSVPYVQPPSSFLPRARRAASICVQQVCRISAPTMPSPTLARTIIEEPTQVRVYKFGLYAKLITHYKSYTRDLHAKCSRFGIEQKNRQPTADLPPDMSKVFQRSEFRSATHRAVMGYCHSHRCLTHGDFPTLMQDSPLCHPQRAFFVPNPCLSPKCQPRRTWRALRHPLFSCDS
jgi:hypothetical protein